MALFVPEKVFEGIVVHAEMGVHQPDYRSEISFIEGGNDLLLHGHKGLLIVTGTDSAVQGVTAEVQVAEADSIRIEGDCGTDEYFADRQSHLPGMEYQVILPEDAITVNTGFLSVLFKNGADGVVRADLD